MHWYIDNQKSFDFNIVLLIVLTNNNLLETISFLVVTVVWSLSPSLASLNYVSYTCNIKVLVNLSSCTCLWVWN